MNTHTAYLTYSIIQLLFIHIIFVIAAITMFNNFTAQKQYESYNIIIPACQSRGPLLIGDFNSATDQDILKQHQIKTVITSAAGLDHLQIPNFVTHIVYPLKDTKSQNIRAYFDESFMTIDRKLDEGGVLVHCAAGVSRSATLIIAYLMRKNQISFKAAIGLVRSKRHGVCPNLGFEMQLKKYEADVVKKPEEKNKVTKKNASEIFLEEKPLDSRAIKIQNKSLFQFTPTQSQIHSKKKQQPKIAHRPFGYSKPRERNLYDVAQTNLFVSGKAAKRPSSQVRDTSDKFESGRKNMMMGTWGPTQHKSKKYQI